MKAWVIERFYPSGVYTERNTRSKWREARDRAINLAAGRDPDWRPERWVICREQRPGWWTSDSWEEARRRDRMTFEKALAALTAVQARMRSTLHQPKFTARMRNVNTGEIILGDIL